MFLNKWFTLMSQKDKPTQLNKFWFIFFCFIFLPNYPLLFQASCLVSTFFPTCPFISTFSPSIFAPCQKKKKAIWINFPVYPFIQTCSSILYLRVYIFFCGMHITKFSWTDYCHFMNPYFILMVILSSIQ